MNGQYEATIVNGILYATDPDYYQKLMNGRITKAPIELRGVRKAKRIERAGDMLRVTSNLTLLHETNSPGEFKEQDKCQVWEVPWNAVTFAVVRREDL